MTSFFSYTDPVLSSHQTLTSIYRSRLATVAAINGACPAGGCALAMCCASWTNVGEPGWQPPVMFETLLFGTLTACYGKLSFILIYHDITMIYPLNIVIFNSYVKFPGGNPHSF